MRASRTIAKILFAVAVLFCSLPAPQERQKKRIFLPRLTPFPRARCNLERRISIGEILSNLSGGIKEGTIYEGLLKLTLQLDLKKIAGWEGASIFASALYPHGNGLSKDYTGDFNILSNIDAYDSVRLFELWFQQKLFDGKMSVQDRANVC